VLGPELTKRINQLADKRLKIKLSQTRADDYMDPRTGEWKFILEADIPGFKDPPLLAEGGVEVDANGVPRGGPDFRIDKRVEQGGSEYRIDIEGIPRLTDHVLAESSERYAKRFGHPPTELSGSLGDDNRAIFQREYIAQINEGTDPNTAEKLAAAATPFVRARKRAKYNYLKVDVKATKPLLIGIPPQMHDVPVQIHITMRKNS
jgi:hypothetical protein